MLERATEIVLKNTWKCIRFVLVTFFIDALAMESIEVYTLRNKLRSFWFLNQPNTCRATESETAL